MHDSKEIVNLQDLFVLILGYVRRYQNIYPPAKYCYIIERVYFIYGLLRVLFISKLSFLLFLYTVSWRNMRDYLHASIDILF